MQRVLYRLEEEVRIEGGTNGGIPVYWDCCMCGAEGEIAGYIAKAGVCSIPAIVPFEDGSYQMLCSLCFFEVKREGSSDGRLFGSKAGQVGSESGGPACSDRDEGSECDD